MTPRLTEKEQELLATLAINNGKGWIDSTWHSVQLERLQRLGYVRRSWWHRWRLTDAGRQALVDANPT